MKRICAIIVFLAVMQLGCSSSPEQNQKAKDQLPKGNYTLTKTVINGTEKDFNAGSYHAMDDAFLNASNFPDGYGFHLGANDTITFAKEMGEYLFDGITFGYSVDGDELQFENRDTELTVPYELQKNELILFPDKGDLEKLTFTYSPFRSGKYNAIGYSIQKSANHQIAHEFLDNNGGIALFDFRKDSTVHIAPVFGLKVFNDSIFDYAVTDKNIVLKKNRTRRSLKYRMGNGMRLYLDDTIFKTIDLIQKKQQ